jgi:hypothetical protein
LNALIPHPTDFAHPSRTHGQGHVARVMIHAFRLIEATGKAEEGARLWGAVYLHDLARTHDGFDEVHGRDAVLRVNESTDLQDRLVAHGIASDDPSMLLAVMMHCLPDDHSAYGGKPIWPLLALLKDANGLDRVRFGDLEKSYLRSEHSRGMVQFAQDLYSQTRRIKEGPNHFTEVLRVAEKILGKPVPIPAQILASPAMTRKVKGAKPVKGAPAPPPKVDPKAAKAAARGAKTAAPPPAPARPAAKAAPPARATAAKPRPKGRATAR